MEPHLSRQPILDLKREVVAYELLHRLGDDDSFDCTDGVLASTQILEMGIFGPACSTITRNKPAYVNFPRTLLVSELLEMIPASVAVEILEDVPADADVLEACRRLKDRGIAIALDDFDDLPAARPLVEYADVLKVDFTKTGPDRRGEIVERYGDQCQMLAEKIESWDQFDEARRLGYTLFQGYYFCEPQRFLGDAMPGTTLAKMRFIRAVMMPEIDFDTLEQIVRADTSLTFKMLRFLNSAVVGAPARVESIRQALVVLGERQLRRWGTLIAMSGLVDEKPRELLITALTRARLSESLGATSASEMSELELFVLGMLTIVEALTETDLVRALDTLQVDDAIRLPLLGDVDSLAGKLLGLILAYERGEWAEVSRLSDVLEINALDLADSYSSAVQWADEVTTSLS